MLSRVRIGERCFRAPGGLVRGASVKRSIAALGAGIASISLVGCAGYQASVDSGSAPSVAATDLESQHLAGSPELGFAEIEEKDTAPGEPGERHEYFMAQRLEGAGLEEYPADQVLAIKSQVELLEDARGAFGDRGFGAGGITSWDEVGPGNIGGRTRAILINPQDPQIMYAAGVGGGVFKSVNAGASWFPLDDFLANIAVNSMAMDPTDPDIIYAGTGEGFFNSDAIRGLGIFKTTDAGATWTQLAGTVDGSVPTGAFYQVNKLQVSPNDPNRVYAATRFGVFRSLNAGTTWASVLDNTLFIDTAAPNGDATNVGFTDLQIQPGTQPDLILASCGSFNQGGMWRSTNIGNAWTKVSTATVLDNPQQGRMTIDFAPSSPNIVYVCMAANGSGPLGTGRVVGVFRSVDSGLTWTQQSAVTPVNTLLLSNTLANACQGGSGFDQGWYDNIIKVDPVNPDVVWVGGIDMFRSDDAGVNFSITSYWWIFETLGQFLHADQHEIVFHPDYNGTTNQTMYVGNDGGVYRTDNALATTNVNQCPQFVSDLASVIWIDLNTSYGVTQYYHGVIAPQADVFLAGAQDNGTSQVTSRVTPEAWVEVFGGDGGYTAISPVGPYNPGGGVGVAFVETQNFGTIRRTDDGGNSFGFFNVGLGPDSGLFITPFEMDPNNPDILWTGGLEPWRTVNGAFNWTNPGPNWFGPAFVSAIAIAPGNSNVVYMGFNDGWITRTSNALDPVAAWTLFSTPNGLPADDGPAFGFVSDLAVDPNDPDICYATYSTFGIDHIYRTTDGGATWTSIDGIGLAGIPDIPVHSIAIRPCDSDQLYAGTEVGVFASDDGGATWSPANAGLANTVIEELDFQGDDVLAAFTHGRGAFVTDLAACGAVPACCLGDADGNQAVNFNDITFVVSNFGNNYGAGNTGPGDSDCNGIVDFNDITITLSNWLNVCP